MHVCPSRAGLGNVFGGCGGRVEDLKDVLQNILLELVSGCVLGKQSSRERRQHDSASGQRRRGGKDTHIAPTLKTKLQCYRDTGGEAGSTVLKCSVP